MLLVVGRIGRAHGVLGEATIEIRTDLPDDRFIVGSQLVTDPADHGPLTIESLRYHNGILLLKFREAHDRTSIEKLRDTLLVADIDMANEAQFEDEFHVQQLIGLSVINETGELIGELSDVLNLPGQDLLAVKTPTGEILIPFVAEFVPEVDIESGRIIVSPPPGLLHLTESADE